MKQIKCYCGHTTTCDCAPLQKQTAVEFLIEQISSSKYFYNLMEEIESRSTIVQPNSILQQAKAMEKEQIIDAYNNADSVDENNIGWTSAERYYKEIYKQD